MDVATFQAQSAYSGAGFTTSESETIVAHPVRRKIVRTLILLGSAGITSTMATLIVAFLGFNSQNLSVRGGVLAVGLCAIYFLSRSKVVYEVMRKIIVKSLSQVKSLHIHDYHELLGIGQGYTISRFVAKADNWMVGQRLRELELGKEGTLILSINKRIDGRDKLIIPSGETVIDTGDRLTLYGRCASCQCLSLRPKGDRGQDAHKKRSEIQNNLESIQSITGGVVEH